MCTDEVIIPATKIHVLRETFLLVNTLGFA